MAVGVKEEIRQSKQRIKINTKNHRVQGEEIKGVLSEKITKKRGTFEKSGEKRNYREELKSQKWPYIKSVPHSL